jgi:hypothetical protein
MRLRRRGLAAGLLCPGGLPGVCSAEWWLCLCSSGMETPAVGGMLPGMQTPEMFQAARAERELWERNKPLTDEELDALLPGPDQVRAPARGAGGGGGVCP